MAEGSDVEAEEYQDITAFGYSCKLFNDPESARALNDGSRLVKWQDRDDLLMDRYDGRLHLDSEDMFKKLKRFAFETYDELLNEEEIRCDDERYRFLPGVGHEGELPQEEEAEDRPSGAAVPFDYDQRNTEGEKEETKQDEKEKEIDDIPFEQPDNLEISPGTPCPPTMRQFALMEKTAGFVVAQGPQMEIILKTKQQGNPKFSFLFADGSYHKFFEQLTKQIRDGTYSCKATEPDASGSNEPQQEKQEEEATQEDDINAIHGAVVVTANPSVSLVPYGDSSDSDSDSLSDNEEAQRFQRPTEALVVIIDKVANYVSKNGASFEQQLRDKNGHDPQFSFLLPWDPYHGFYKHRLSVANQRKIRRERKERERLLEKKKIETELATERVLDQLLNAPAEEPAARPKSRKKRVFSDVKDPQADEEAKKQKRKEKLAKFKAAMKARGDDCIS